MTNKDEELVSKLLSRGPVIKVPRDPAFVYPEYRADEWDPAVLAQFVVEKLDLPQYEQAIKDSYINGQSFLSLHELLALDGLHISHPLHKVKLLTHAQHLRELVFQRIERHEKKNGSKPAKFWTAADTAMWLIRKGKLSKLAPLLAFKHNWCGSNIFKIPDDPHLPKKLSCMSSPEAAALIAAVRDLMQEHPDLVPKKKDPLKANPLPQVSQVQENDFEVSLQPQENTSASFANPSRILPAVSATTEVAEKVPSNRATSAFSPSLGDSSAIPEIDIEQMDLDRRNFLSKIDNLQKNLSHHTKSMDVLREKADQLEKEREASMLQKIEVQTRSKASQKLMESLIQDRDLVAKELERVARLYQAQIEKDTLNMSQKIDYLNSEILKTKRETQALAAAAEEPMPSKLQVSQLAASVPASVVLAVPPLGDDDSDMESVGAVEKRSAIPVEAGRAFGSDDARAPSSHGLLPIAQTLSLARLPAEALPTPIAPPSHAPSPAMPPPSSDAHRTLNLQEFIKSSTQLEVGIWKKLLDRYRVQSAGLYNNTAAELTISATVGDTRQMMMRIATLWMSIGRTISVEAHGVAGAEELRRALTGVRKCSATAIQIHCRPSGPDNKDAALPISLLKAKRNADQSGPWSLAAEAIYNTFVLALVARLFQKLGSDQSDKSQLMFLLARADAGELPLSEISRDGLREFMRQQLSLELPWDQFDALAQRVDLNKSGYIHAPEVLTAFRRLTPLWDRLPGATAQQVTQLLLSISSESLVGASKLLRKDDRADTQPLTLSELWLKLLVSRQDSSPSFRKYLQSLQLVDSGPIPSGMTGMQLSLSQMSLLTGKELRQHIEARWVEDQLLVTDLLFELSKDFIFSLQAVVLDANHPSGKAYLWKSLSMKEDVVLAPALVYLLENHHEACSLVAKSLNIFDTCYAPTEGAPSKDILSTFSDTLVDWTELRLRVLQFNAVAPTAHAHMSSDEKDPVAREVAQDEMGIRAAAIEAWLTQCIAQSPLPFNANQHPQYIDSKLLDDWRQAERLAIFVPCSTSTAVCTAAAEKVFEVLPPLSASQVLLEWAIARVTTKVSKYQQTKTRAFADSAALRQVQQDIHRSLWQTARPQSPKPEAVGRPQLAVESHLVSTVNEFNSQQRVDQVAQYLEVLNQRAIAKKRLLQTLMELWSATKALLTPLSPSKVTTKRSTATREDVISQTKTLQDRLLLDMQTKPNVKTQQLERRVQSLLSTVIPGQEPGTDAPVSTSQLAASFSSALGGEGRVDNVLYEALWEVRSLQQSLLQANNDAMRISGRILQALTTASRG